ncbi:MAG TPA: hypothetical protein VII94_04255 [Candidatus Saccharimonadales bacterium]
MRFVIITISSIIFITVSFTIILSKNSQQVAKESLTTAASLLPYENNTSSVSFTTFGNLVSGSQQTALRIKISSSNVNISILNGSQESIVKTENFSSNQTTYNHFLANLNSNDFLVSQTSSLAELSACPKGETYQLNLSNNSTTVSNLWDDNCNTGSDGTFKGNGNQNVFAIETLFENQITNYSDFISGYSF